MMWPIDHETIKLEQRERLQRAAVDRLVRAHRPNKRIRHQRLWTWLIRPTTWAAQKVKRPQAATSTTNMSSADASEPIRPDSVRPDNQHHHTPLKSEEPRCFDGRAALWRD